MLIGDSHSRDNKTRPNEGEPLYVSRSSCRNWKSAPHTRCKCISLDMNRFQSLECMTKQQAPLSAAGTAAVEGSFELLVSVPQSVCSKQTAERSAATSGPLSAQAIGASRKAIRRMLPRFDSLRRVLSSSERSEQESAKQSNDSKMSGPSPVSNADKRRKRTGKESHWISSGFLSTSLERKGKLERRVSFKAISLRALRTFRAIEGVKDNVLHNPPMNAKEENTAEVGIMSPAQQRARQTSKIDSSSSTESCEVRGRCGMR